MTAKFLPKLAELSAPSDPAHTMFRGIVTLLPAFAAGYSLGATRFASRTAYPVAGVAANAFRTITRGGQTQTGISMAEAGLCKKLEVPAELLDSVDIFIFDCDGVIWKGDSLIDGVPAVLEMLRKAGKKSEPHVAQPCPYPYPKPQPQAQPQRQAQPQA